MTNLTDPRLIWLKGELFVALGLLASAMLIAQLPDIRYTALLAIAVWAFCRAYYFVFYVIERYVDPSFRFFDSVPPCLHVIVLPLDRFGGI